INAVPTNVNSFGSFPPCPSDFPTSVAVVAQACWKLINTNVDPTKAPNYAAIPCTGESGYCITTYAVCDDHGTLVTTKLSTQSVTGDCTDIPVSGEWEPGVCYTLNYCAD
ncbi:MAG TPA: hypothetical protein VFO76_01725, partial [Candidatus Kapabacteria bacterium]|nr:hypothetical protein [Candidatus Kapabacteria bacterium]